MTLSNHKFLLGLPDATFGKDKKAGEMSKMMDLIKEHNMSLYYSEYATALGFDVEETLLKTMQEANEKTLKELEEKIEDAKKNAGDTEVRITCDALQAFTLAAIFANIRLDM